MYAPASCSGKRVRLRVLLAGAIAAVATLLGPPGSAAAVGTASIQGTVTGSNGGGPVQDVCVAVVDANDIYDQAGLSLTDNSGEYSIPVPAGIYRVQFDPTCGPFWYLAEWWNNQPSFYTADNVVAVAGATTANAELALGGIISGTVSGAGGGGLVDICATAYDLNHEALGFGVTDTSGNYWIAGLESDSYKLEFDASCADSGYLSEWWNDKVSFSTAQAIAFVAGATVDADATLAGGGAGGGGAGGGGDGGAGGGGDGGGAGGGVDTAACDNAKEKLDKAKKKLKKRKEHDASQHKIKKAKHKVKKAKEAVKDAC